MKQATESNTLEGATAATAPPETGLAHGRQLALLRGPAGVEHLQITSPSGLVELAITIGTDGPRLAVRAVDIEIVAKERLSMRCTELDIQVDGDAVLAAQGAVTIAGRDLQLSAPGGEIALRADDDVDIKGERIRLNCDEPPMPLTWEAFEAARQGQDQ